MTDETAGTTQETTTGTSEETKATAGKTQASSEKVDGKTAQEWASSYKGLQGAYQKLQNNTTQEIADLTAKLEQASQQVEELNQGGTSKESQLTVLQQQVAKLTQELEDVKGEKDKSDKRLGRLDVVLTDFPELASWEAQGLLPSADTDDALKEALGKFRDTLSKQVGTGVKQSMSGASPAGSGKTDASTLPSGDGGGESEEYVWQQMTQFAGRDDAKFNEWQRKWDEIQAAKNTSK